MEQIATVVPLGRIELEADIVVPANAGRLVVFAHGSGSSRRSPRNRQVAALLNRGAIGTVLVDLLTGDEGLRDVRTAELRFDIPLLGQRLIEITDWIGRQPGLRRLALGYFGASTGAAAALVAAARRPQAVHAVVSRGGRPDLAGPALREVLAPVLFIVGENDPAVLSLNSNPMAQLPRGTEARLEVVPGATHLFEEPGALETVAALARDWFQARLSPGVDFRTE